MSIEKLRTALHEAIDATIDRHVGGASQSPGRKPGPSRDALAIMAGEDSGPFDHRWPLDVIEHYTTSRRYSVTDQGETLPVVVGWTVRDAWGRPDRKRVVVFGLSATDARYPWAEFVESDDGRYSAAVPVDPSASRAQLKVGDAIPDRFQSAVLERTDKLFKSVRNGPALRLVVDGEDVTAMIEFGYWLAGERKKL